MSAEIVGKITCPLCGNAEATVHRQQRGGKKGASYVRCYTSPGGVTMSCGTLQCIGPTGQAFIAANMRPLEAIGTQEPEPVATAPENPIAAPPVVAPIQMHQPTPKARRQRSSLFDGLARLLAESDE